MSQKIRLIPISIVVFSLVLGIKVVDFSFGVEEAIAASSEPEKQESKENQTQDGEAVDTPQTDDTPAVAQLSSIPTRKEIEYLQKLSQRRQELNKRERELDDREKLLEAVEMRIVERTNSLKKIEETIEAALKKHDEREQAQLEKLVKIYSAMKPKEAAKIFNSLESSVLIPIVEQMKEKNMGAILAKMDTNKAKKLTVSLATRQKLPKIEG